MKKLLIVLSLVSMSALATVDFTVGQVVDKAADGSYSVHFSNDNSVWSGVLESDLSEQQIKDYQAEQDKLNAVKSLPPTTTTTVITPPVVSVFKTVRGGYNQHNDNSSHEHGTGNGGNNAANSNSAHGLGGGNHIGGGSAQSGSRSHW